MAMGCNSICFMSSVNYNPGICMDQCCFLFCWFRMFAGVVPRVLSICFGGFVFLGAYEKSSVYLQTWQNLPSQSHHKQSPDSGNLTSKCGLHLLYHKEGHNRRTPEAPQPCETIHQLYTAQVEKDGILPFINTLLQRRVDDSLEVTVYRKLTHTDQFLDFRSHHPSHVKS